MENGIKLDYTFLEYTHINCINMYAVFNISYKEIRFDKKV